MSIVLVESRFAKKPHRPCGIKIAAWSFLLYALLSDAPIYPDIQSISPNSQFAPLVKITNADNQLKVCSDTNDTKEKLESDTTFLYTAFFVSRGLEAGLSLSDLRRIIKLPNCSRVKIEKIDIQDGVYITYRQRPGSSAKVFHYFRNKSRARTFNHIEVGSRSFRRIFVEELSCEKYKEITEENNRAGPLPVSEVLKCLTYNFKGKATVSEYAKKMEISPQKVYRSLDLLAQMGLVTANTAMSGGYEYRITDDLMDNTAERRRVLEILARHNDGKNRKDIEAIQGKLNYTVIDSVKAYEPARVLFSPDGSSLGSLSKEIANAHNAIDIVMYNFKSDVLLSALKNRRPGVRVRIVLNKDQADDDISKKLVKCGVNIMYDSRNGLMHDKFIIVDKKVVVTGSSDWDEKAGKINEDSLVLTQYADGFQEEFDYLWGGEKRLLPRNLSPPDGVRAYFSSQCECETAIINSIHKAKIRKLEHPAEDTSIRIAQHSFTNKKIAKALFDARESGVNIQILLDPSQQKKGIIKKYFCDLQKKAERQEAVSGINNYRRGDISITYDRVSKRLMSNEFVVIGNETVTGSYDWDGKKTKERESLVFIPCAVKEYKEKFDSLWKESYKTIVIDRGQKAKKGPGGDGEKGRWVSVPVKYDELNENNSYELFGESHNTVKFNIKDRLQYDTAPPEIAKKLMAELGQNAENFDGPMKVYVAKKNIFINRFFHCDENGTKVEKKSWIEGRWFSDSSYDDPADAIKNFYFVDWNNAQMRLNSIIKKGCYFIWGGIKNGGKGVYQIYIPFDAINRKEVIFCLDRIERFIPPRRN